MLDQLLESFNVLTDEEITNLFDLIQRQINLEQLVEQTESFLTRAKAELREISEIEIPNKFSELQISEFTLKSGHKVSIKPFVQAKIPEQRKEEAFEWLVEHDFGDIIKVDVLTRFKADGFTDAIEFAQDLQNSGYNVNIDRNVHPQTLKAFCRRMLEEMPNFPVDMFGVYAGRKAVIK